MPPAPPAFLYFDLGNVLLNFDHRRSSCQMAEVAGIAPERVWQVVFESPLLIDFETGHVDERQFYEAFCNETGARPDLHALIEAASAIFDINTRVLPILIQLEAAGHRLGILSNTNPSHWNYCTRYFGVVPDTFDTVILSYEVGAMKPDPTIFRVAADRAGVAPEAIFFVDDREENVAGARAFGFDAVLFTSARKLANDLRARGIRCNY
ncbi:MAG: HAD family hydrolase [Pirellulales bacterium]